MQFLNLFLLLTSVLVRLALSQVIVTVTEVVTVDPVITTTITTIVTITRSSTTTSKSSSKLSTTTRRPGFPPGPTTVTSTVFVTQTQGPQPSPTNGDPNATKCPVPHYYQCGGTVWTGCKVCERGLVCYGDDNEWFSMCVKPEDATPGPKAPRAAETPAPSPK